MVEKIFKLCKIFLDGFMDYIKRIIDKDLNLRQQAFGAINILGPKGCGKTRTAKERCSSIIEFEDESRRDSYLLLADSNINAFLNFPRPILFDEWQDCPKIWGLVRLACDKEENFGQFYLTGSSTKKIDTAHTGTTRISTVTMYPMSLFESADSNGKISLKQLFDNPNLNTDGLTSEFTIDKLIFATCRGGWPKCLSIKNDDAKLLVAKDYFNQIINRDISHIDGKKRNPEVAKSILKSYARNISTLAKKNVIYNDVIANHRISEEIFDDYISKLKELYVIEDIEAWSPQIRSKKAMRYPKKRIFIDPSIAVAALGLPPKYFLKDFDMFGHIFESLVFRDLKIYSAALGGEFKHYHDAYDLEVDGVLTLDDGRYALVEVKLGSKRIDEGIKNLLKVEQLIKAANANDKSLHIREPDLLLIITSGEISFSKDGVRVIPITCLKD